ncbi:biotin-dependent carboxyltransferase family protein [Streptomyces sp. NPDC004539]|uniref:5-oxoprolinase subunit C family protein n=1 Tax=Streptomyces sp. NPDC004539 TaxID=3154280 RepID=UPI0033B288B2
MADTLTVTTPGLTTVQDLGRLGRSRHGLPPGGALDQHSARVANVLCGNDEHAPLLEITALDLACTPSADILIAVTGAPADLTVDGTARPRWEPVPVRAGETLRVTGIHVGLRAYLAVLGSFDAEYLQGSCAPDTVLGFGRTLRAGDVLTLRTACPPLGHLPFFRLSAPAARFPAEWTVDVTDGPDRAEFGDTHARLFGRRFTVTPQSNHIGLRLRTDGPLPRRTATGEVLSRGVPVGAVEVPAGDELLVLHRGRGVTAGYPVLAVATTTGLDVLGQVRPGQSVRFRHRTLPEAVVEHRARRAAVEALRTRVRTAFHALSLPLHQETP